MGVIVEIISVTFYDADGEELKTVQGNYAYELVVEVPDGAVTFTYSYGEGNPGGYFEGTSNKINVPTVSSQYDCYNQKMTPIA